MRPGAAFRRILDEKLADDGCRWTSQQASVASARNVRTAAESAFLFGGVPGARAATFAAAFAYTGRSSGWPTPPAVPAAARPRPARQLTPAQQRALECLRSFGAGTLEAGSSEAEVKSAFRTLAHRYHPDCHPGADDRERTSLASDFGRIVQAYHQFTAVTTH